MKKTLTAIIAISFLASSCNFIGGERVYGNGHITSQERPVGSFNSIKASGAMNVHVSQNPTQSVKIEGDDNLMQYIDVYIEDNTLVVRQKDGYNLQPTKDLVVYASAPVFKEIDVSGAGDIIGDNAISGTEPIHMHVSGSGNIKMQVNAPNLTTEVSGSGDVALKGRVRDFSVEMSGSGSVKCFDLVTDNTTLDMSGSSDAEVYANKKLDVHVSGSGSIRYKGAASVDQHVSGSGDVRKAD